MTAGFPDLRIHKNAGIQSDDIISLSDHGTPPCFLNIPDKFYANRAEIITAGQSSIYIAAGKDKASPLAQRDQFVHIDIYVVFRQYITPCSFSRPVK
jgi:hypothetical protein